MNKFEVLKYNQMFMSWLGIYSYRLKESTIEFYKSALAHFILFHLIMVIISCSVFVHNSPDFKKKLEAILLIVAATQALGSYLNVAFKMREVKCLHLRLQEIVDGVEEKEATAIYWNTEQKCRKYTKLIFSYIFCHQSTFGAALFFSFYCLRVKNFDTSTWFLPFTMIVPFNTRVFSGWYLFWFIQFNISLSYISCMVSMASYFLCSCFYIEAICDHFVSLINSIHKTVERNQIEKDQKKILNNRLKIKDQIHTAINLHVNIFRIFRMVADINSGTIFALLPLNAVFVGISMYNTEHSAVNMAPAFILYNVLCIVSSLMWPYIFGHFATKVTERVLSIGDVIYESNWYDYPSELRKYVTLIIARSHQEIYFTGFNMVGCTLAVFGRIVRSSCSFYILFRSFTQR